MESIRFRRGFTLIELLVVLAIVLTITAIILTSQSSFNKTLILANTAYDIALTIRSAETYGLSSHVANGGSTNAGYGVHFDSGSPGSFVLFVDSYPAVGQSGLCHTPPVEDPTGPDAQPGSCAFNANEAEEISNYSLGNGITISNFCAFNGNNDDWSCEQANGLTSLDIIFARPNPDPFMSVNGSYSESSPITQACITVTSPQGGSRFVSVESSGEIIANATSCP